MKRPFLFAAALVLSTALAAQEILPTTSPGGGSFERIHLQPEGDSATILTYKGEYKGELVAVSDTAIYFRASSWPPNSPMKRASAAPS